MVVDKDGRVISSATNPLTLSTPYPLWSEQNPQEWWAGMVPSIRSALDLAGATGEQIAAIGLTGQMHGLVLLDENGGVLRPAILWNDQRTAAECAALTERERLERELVQRERLAAVGQLSAGLVDVARANHRDAGITNQRFITGTEDHRRS